MTAKRVQAVMPRDVVARIIDAATTNLVLVGGQALGVWMDRYGIPMPGGFTYVSQDVDFLAPSINARDDVRRLARALGGQVQLSDDRALAFTALIGQAVREVDGGEVFNVDVMHRVFRGKDVYARAIELERENGIRYRVMHPLDVLKSRLDNLYGIEEKQTDLGRAQLTAAVEMTRAFLLDAAEEENKPRDKRPPTLRYVGFIDKLAGDDAGKKVAKRDGIFVADAIEPDAVPSREFREKMLPRLAKMMSPARRKALGLM